MRNPKRSLPPPRTPAPPAATRAAVHKDAIAPGSYLTDGVFLFRVVRRIVADGGDLVELEDCYGLDVVRVPAAELRWRELRAVTPANG